MPKTSDFTVLENKQIAADTYKMVLSGDTSGIIAPGQFVNIKLDGFYLRRPISICDWDDKTLTLVYKTIGKGTEDLSTKKEGSVLNILLSLGNGYTIADEIQSPLLIGGGVGVPPLYALAKALIKADKKPTVVLGFQCGEAIFLKDEFEALGLTVLVATADGSCGTNGFVTDAIKAANVQYDYFYTCGPEPMLKALCNTLQTEGQLSFEERMACGFGACMGCSCKTKYGNKRICKDGPVLLKSEIIW